ncbi:DUF4376 domain-containing protein [Fusobacterium necrophorum]|uniref:PF14301 domain protein n=4 Tax=Fusobacterium necrophorum TaxID=859 RepID=A0AAN4AU05_9FUSO|nr:DUF4376 domain-containing protein [Fusobacterium necrophorum]AYV94685.1 DUF4376 domain-containing protein [Fusobacterium necrophorum subsp. funduliforme]EJU18802.1 PF14301 domain protein [Fusobacterium necrophorum subsp. funduliforme Fnf 1007]KYM52172.1 hypothetical protein A2U04_10155 [Fusobacterium necrophorum subsp. funduliforme]KYM55326.1 hypothetical protein A2U06_08725 [Fusobacterium necrophorum subsp. funduliforme]KYM56521.1 hypothetical protein A2U17_01835 [Fusobacterium necrophorum
MKKYIFKIEEVKTGKLFPFKILNADEEFSVENPQEYIIFEADSYNEVLVYYDIESNSIQKKSKTRLFQEGIYRLKIGEIFEEETQEFKMIEQPSKYHKWNGKTWEVNIEEVREIKRQELKHIREQKISENIEVHGSLFQVREKDLENFEDVARAIRRKKKTEEDTRAWILADNSIKTFTYAQLLDVLDERALRKEKIFNEYGSLAIQLQQANTVKQIEKITWEAKK